MSPICGDEGFPPQWDGQGSSAHEEKIFVSIRVRPLNDREISRNDFADWECINNNTILLKNSQGERSSTPTAYQFDRVFGCECSTRQVYDEAAKKVFLSVLNGINSSIFAYGQTSSGKTFTMSGVTEYALQDIYEHIDKIYNEVVRDLLSSDNTPLRLLDDPERGTVVEKLSEVTLTDQSHLNELLSMCEAQRQIGETSLNGMSSRSHQILRLAVESSAKQYSHSQNNSTLSAAVNFIDLAGSERASQTLSAGTRLKEGCHINRSLLTLGTVIRKLSKGRNGHIPYRDSKLTRILQNSLGGNARTAIICTMSPAHSHVEQSRNTLLFATCAKQVATKAKVNVVMSDKALVRQLQKELARLENELRALKSRSTDENSALVLKEKEGVIEKMYKEMRELMMQRDIAQSRMQSLLHSRSSWTEMSYQLENEFQTPEEYTASEASDTPFVQMEGPFSSSSSSSSSRFEEQRIVDDKAAIEEPFLSDDTSPRLFIDKYFGPDPCKNLQIPPTNHGSVHSFADSCKEVQCIEMDIDSTHSEGAKDEEVNNGSKAFTTESKSGANDDDDFLDVIVKEHKFKISMGDDVIAYEDVEAMPENQFCDDPNRAVPEEQVFDNEFPKDDLKTEALAEVVGNSEWSQEFERQRREIIELWDVCHMPLVHRTYFFLLFKGDPSDAVYMEVELRRLQFLKNSWSQGERIVKDGQIITEAASIKGMKREREMLCRQMLKVLSGSERNKLFQKWGVGLNSKKRRLQLCNKLWKDSKDMDHLKQSASLVAKLVGIIGPNEASKAMFELNFSPQPINHLRSFSWAPRMAFMI